MKARRGHRARLLDGSGLGELDDGLFRGEADAQRAEGRRRDLLGRRLRCRGLALEGGEAMAPGLDLLIATMRGQGGPGPAEVGERSHEGGRGDAPLGEDKGEMRPQLERGGGRLGPAITKRLVVVVGESVPVGRRREILERREVEIGRAGADVVEEPDEVAQPGELLAVGRGACRRPEPGDQHRLLVGRRRALFRRRGALGFAGEIVPAIQECAAGGEEVFAEEADGARTVSGPRAAGVFDDAGVLLRTAHPETRREAVRVRGERGLLNPAATVVVAAARARTEIELVEPAGEGAAEMRKGRAGHFSSFGFGSGSSGGENHGDEERCGVRRGFVRCGGSICTIP